MKPNALCSDLPFRILYNNDLTNVTTCIWHAHPNAADPFDPSMLRESVREVAGLADVHLIQLATGRVPWYQSRIYSMEEHRDWYCRHFDVSPDDPIFTTGYNGYLLRGGDLLQDFIGYCREFGQRPFVSMRMNDTHGLEWVDTPGNRRFPHCISRFYAEHPEYRLSDGKGWYERGLDWAHEEVRTSLLELIEEQCKGYDLDGFELDFQRHPRFFREAETTPEFRAEIMTGFIRAVREILDRTARGGQHRYLSVRIPCYRVMLSDCGLDVTAFRSAGVDLTIISDHYFSSMDTEFRELAARSGGVPAFFECCHTTYTGRQVGLKPGQPNYDSFTFRRTTPEQYRTLANLAYRAGGAGISFFNFAYYREHGTDGRGPFTEPPFTVLRDCADPETVANAAQDALLTPGWSIWGGPVQKIRTKQLPRTMTAGAPETFRMEIYPQPGAASVTRLRVQTAETLTDQVFSAWLNGKKLEPTRDISEPYGVQYPPLLGTPETLRAFTVPLSDIRAGENTVTLSLAGSDCKVIILNLCTPFVSDGSVPVS